MTSSSPDGSRDRRIEDPSNLWLIHPVGRALLPHAIALGVSANAVSVIGLFLGAGAALSYANWHHWPSVVLGLALSIGWLIADGLDGMIARATRTASAFGRVLDGLCDHGVFVLIYVLIARAIGTREGWMLAIVAGVAHAIQSSLYEGDRARFHRRSKGNAAIDAPPAAGSAPVRLYDRVAGSLDRIAAPFETALGTSADPATLGRIYAVRSAPAMRLMALLSANVRVGALALFCLAGNPRIFWWFEIVPLSVIAITSIVLHRRVERQLVPDTAFAADRLAPLLISKEQGR